MATFDSLKPLLRAATLALCLCGATAVAAEQSAVVAQALQRAKALLEAQQAQQAYELLAQEELDGAGDVDFDYTLGVAALEAGKPDKATLAFDRVLALNPRHAGALIDRGRAHAALGAKQEARIDFDAALALDPPPALRKRLESFLAQLDGKSSTRGLKLGGYTAVTLGHDSNVNFAASERNVFVPFFGETVVLSADSTRQRDAFATFAGGAALNYGVSERYGWGLALDGYSKRNQDIHQFTLSGLDLRAGPYFGGEKQQWRLLMNGGAVELGDAPYRKHYGVAAEWRYALSAGRQWLAAVQHTRYRYRQADTQVFDTNQSVILFGFSILSNRDIPRSVTPYLWVGNEDDQGGNPEGDKRSAGVGVSGRWGLTPTRALTWSLSAQRGSYQNEQPAFFERRRDRRYDATLAFNQQFGRGWTLRPQVTWTKQASNLDPFDFERVEAGLTLRRDFE